MLCYFPRFNIYFFLLKGLPQAISVCVRRVARYDEELAKEMANNIVLSGGGSLLPGLPCRLQCALNSAVASRSSSSSAEQAKEQEGESMEKEEGEDGSSENVARVDLVGEYEYSVIASRYREWDTWRGGVALSRMSFFPQILVKLDDFTEVGPRVCTRMCY